MKLWRLVGRLRGLPFANHESAVKARTLRAQRLCAFCRGRSYVQAQNESVLKKGKRKAVQLSETAPPQPRPPRPRCPLRCWLLDSEPQRNIDASTQRPPRHSQTLRSAPPCSPCSAPLLSEARASGMLAAGRRPQPRRPAGGGGRSLCPKQNKTETLQRSSCCGSSESVPGKGKADSAFRSAGER